MLRLCFRADSADAACRIRWRGFKPKTSPAAEAVQPLAATARRSQRALAARGAGGVIETQRLRKFRGDQASRTQVRPIAHPVEYSRARDPSSSHIAAPRWASPPASRISFEASLVLLYLCVAGVFAASPRSMAWSQHWTLAQSEADLRARSLTASSGSAACAASRAVSSPVTIGSGVVLPADYDDWDSEKLRIVLAHERSHIRQGDFYLQLLAGLYAALFWFSPLGWWLKRKLSDLAEAISDRAGLEEAASRSSYAQILLEFAAAPRPTLIGVAMARTGSLSRRIERLLNDVSFRQAFAGSRRALAAVLWCRLRCSPPRRWSACRPPGSTGAGAARSATRRSGQRRLTASAARLHQTSGVSQPEPVSGDGTGRACGSSACTRTGWCSRSPGSLAPSTPSDPAS